MTIRTIQLLVGLVAITPALPETLVITRVTMISPRTSTVTPNVNVIIDGGRIRAVQSVALKVPDGARIVDGRRKYLMPGLWDAHVHLTKAGVLSLPLFVANGVTGVRDLGSDIRDISQWRNEIEAGRLIGPRIKSSGQILESRANFERMKSEGGVEPVDRLRIGVANPEEGRAAVKRLAEQGADLIKMRSTPDLATFQAVAGEAAKRKLPFAAHPLGKPEELLAAGLNSVEHLISYPGLSASEVERRKLFRAMAARSLYMSNTMANFDPLLSVPYAKGKQMLDDAGGRIDFRRKYVCGYLISDWREQIGEVKEAAYEPLRKELPNIYRDFREMREEGVPFLAGTDVGVLFMYAGFSLHDELAALVRHVGFTPMEALRIATDGVASFHGETKVYGAIETGQAADLVLLDADPLTDIRNTKRISGVVVSGRWLDRKALNRILNQIERGARGDCGSGGRASARLTEPPHSCN